MCRDSPGLATLRATNVLFLLSDEHSANVMGCAGHPLIRTPNLDRLAASGTRFANAYTPCPICVPARASLITGRYVHETGYWDNALAYDGRVPGFGHRLQAAGVRVEAIGKLHYRNDTDPTGFDRQQIPAHIVGGGQIWGSVRDPLPEGTRRTPIYDEIGAGESSYNRYDRQIADLAVGWLETRSRERNAQPWLLYCGFVAPHFPLIVPQRYLDLYPLDDIPDPKLLPRNGFARHPWVERKARYMDHDEEIGSDGRRRLAMACYFGLVTYLDEQVGRILDAVERLGLRDTTRIVYTSDHGEENGARALWGKGNLYRDSTHVPMIVSGPDIPAGKVCATNVSLIDLYPTFVDSLALADEPADRALPGRSLLRIADEPDDPRRLAFSEYHAVGGPSGAYMLADGRYKYHHYVGYPPELFDLRDDPEEERNLAADPAFAEVVAAFETRLRCMLDPEAVDRKAKADQNALVAQHGGRDVALQKGPKGSTPVPDLASAAR
jgi:choline-sulfatase